MDDDHEDKPGRTWLKWLFRPSTLIVMLLLSLVAVSPFTFRNRRVSKVININDFDAAPLITESISLNSSPANAYSDFHKSYLLRVEEPPYEREEFATAMWWQTSDIPETYQKWIDHNAVSLQIWREAALSKSVFTELDLDNDNFDTDIPVTADSGTFALLMMLKAKQEYFDRNLAESFNWLRATVRTGLLFGQNGTILMKQESNYILIVAIQNGLIPFISNGRHDEPALQMFHKQLQDDYQQLKTKSSHTYKVQAILCENSLIKNPSPKLMGPPPGHSKGPFAQRVFRTQLYFAAEPDITLRLNRQVTANLLSQCDLPAYKRTIAEGFYIDLYSPASPPFKQKMMTPKQINDSIPKTLFRRLIPTPDYYIIPFDQFDANWAAFNAAFLLEIHRRRHGGYPERLSDLDRDLQRDLPLDPYTGNQLILKSYRGGAASIYSLGANRTDDGGLFEKAEDVGFLLGLPPLYVK